MNRPDPLPHEATVELRGPRYAHSRQSARFGLFARLVLSDSLALLIGYSVAKAVREITWLAPGGINLFLVIAPVYFVFAINAWAYSAEALTSFAESARRSLTALVQTYLFTCALLFVTQSGEDISRVALATAFVATLAPMLLFRFFSYTWVTRALSGVLQDELVIVDDVDARSITARFMLNAAENGLRPDLNDPAMLERVAEITGYYDRVLVACPQDRQVLWANMLKTIDVLGELVVEPRRDLGVIGLGNYGESSTLIVSRGSLNMADRIKKRVFDLAIAIPALIFLAPLMLAVAVLIKLDSRGPVFFRQPRLGRNNIPFQIYKFRSMRQESGDLAGARSTGRDDERISRFGRFIRMTSIDELPQLINVVTGDMSMVGPRPHALGSTAEDQLFWEITQRYWERHKLKPGITGLAQVRGYRGATEKTTDLVNRLNSDLEYLAGWRLWRDVTILFHTLGVLVHPNAY